MILKSTFLIILCSTLLNAGEVVSDSLNYTRLYSRYHSVVDSKIHEMSVEPDSLDKNIDYVFVDVRENEEQKVSMLKDAVTSEYFQKNAKKFKNKKIIAYCTIGYRSGKFTEKWRKKGYDIQNLVGGVLLWSHQGKPFYQSKDNSWTPTDSVHVYDDEWNFLHSSKIAVH